MKSIPITQMEILHNSSAIFPKDLPLNPYYKALTSDILTANHSLKSGGDPALIESFFRQYICDKEEDKNSSSNVEEEEGQEQEEHDDYLYYDEDDDNGDDPGYHKEASSQTSSKYTASKKFNSTTSLQEILSKQRLKDSLHSRPIKEKPPFHGPPPPQKDSCHEPEYYCFPNKYRNYKYVKGVFQQLEQPKPKEKNRKHREKRFETTVFDSKLSESSSLNAFHRSFYEKTLKTREQLLYLLPEERARIIKKNLQGLNSPSKPQNLPIKHWVSPFIRHPKLPKIPETSRNSLSLRQKITETPEKSRFPSHFGISVTGKAHFPRVPIPERRNRSPIDYKEAFAEFQTLKKMSQRNTAATLCLDPKLAKYKPNGLFLSPKVAQNIGKPSPKLAKRSENPSKNQCDIAQVPEIFEKKALLGLYSLLFAGKPRNLVDLMLLPFGIPRNGHLFPLQFEEFLRFRTLLLPNGNLGMVSSQDEARYLGEVLLEGGKEAKNSQIKGNLGLIIGGSCGIQEEIGKRLEVFSLGSQNREAVEEKIGRDWETRTFLMQKLRETKPI